MIEEDQEEAELALSEIIHDVLTDYIQNNPKNGGISDTRIILGAFSKVIAGIMQRATILDELDEALAVVSDTILAELSIRKLREREKSIARHRHYVVGSDTIANRRRAEFKVISGSKSDNEIPE